jgi:hypothetical protein
MKKVAIFVEGLTEQLFVIELIKHLFGKNCITIDIMQFTGKAGARNISIIKGANISQDTLYYFRIYDCHGGGNKSTVKSDLSEQLSGLLKQSFSSIIGIRDVYPLTDIIKLRQMMSANIPVSNIPIKIILAINEVEAWFIAEENHYQVISSILTINLVNSIAKIDIRKDTTETILHPAGVLHDIYKCAGLSYINKKTNQIQRTVNALDYNNLFSNVSSRNNSFKELLDSLDIIFE